MKITKEKIERTGIFCPKCAEVIIKMFDDKEIFTKEEKPLYCPRCKNPKWQ